MAVLALTGAVAIRFYGLDPNPYPPGLAPVRRIHECTLGESLERAQIQHHKTMKFVELTGSQIKQDNGSGYALSQAFKGHRYHDSTLYRVTYNGVNLDNSTVVSIRRAR
jgi:hypothetical protein